MQKLSYLFIVGFVLLSSACSQSKEKPGNFSVKGTIKNYTGAALQLSEISATGLRLIDSAKVDEKGNFEFKNSVSQPTFAIIGFSNTAIVLLLDSGLKTTLSIDAKTPEAYGVSGSLENEQLRQIILMNNKYLMQVSALEKKYTEAAQQKTMTTEMENQIKAEYQTLMDARTIELKEKTLSIENGLVPYFVTNFLMPEADFEFFNKVDEKFYSRYPNSKYAQDLHARVTKLKGTAHGQTVSDIVLQDPYGKTIALSSLRGKYVLIDFWASWCGPCRRENPNVVKMYQKYKDKGFDIYSVSLDDNKDAWIKAINTDQLLWSNHVSDLKKWNSSVVPQFNIESIPFTMLIDAEGKIIGKNLRGEALEQKLKSIFNY
jgi:thiol-disulfide isomerase/thioredoxin